MLPASGLRTLGRDLCRSQRRKRGEKKRAQKDLHTGLDPALARMSLYSFCKARSHLACGKMLQSTVRALSFSRAVKG
jgi:hypothetical protein